MVIEPFFIADFVNYLYERGINAKIIIVTVDGDVLIFDPYEWSIYYTVANAVRCNVDDVRTPWAWISRDYVMKKAIQGVYITYWGGIVIPCSLEVRIDCLTKLTSPSLRDKDTIRKEAMRIKKKCIEG